MTVLDGTKGGVHVFRYELPGGDDDDDEEITTEYLDGLHPFLTRDDDSQPASTYRI